MFLRCLECGNTFKIDVVKDEKVFTCSVCETDYVTVAKDGKAQLKEFMDENDDFGECYTGTWQHDFWIGVNLGMTIKCPACGQMLKRKEGVCGEYICINSECLENKKARVQGYGVLRAYPSRNKRKLSRSTCQKIGRRNSQTPK